MSDTLTPREPYRLTDDALPTAAADGAEADTAEEVSPQKVVVTTNPYRNDRGLVLHMWEVTPC